MGYMHIDSLYKFPDFFHLFTEVYAMEKIHGTSTWFHYDAKNNMIKFHSGGEKYEDFRQLFDYGFLSRILHEICSENNWDIVKVHGEGYGGKQQKMSATYGPKLRFIAFDVYVETDETTFFLDVPLAEQVVKKLNLEFVHYVEGPNNPEWIESQSNMESVQAIRKGMGSGKLREGVVIRPLTETKMKNGKRAIFKHKNAEFWEIRSRRPLGERVKVAEVVNEIVNDWVTENRFQHVVDRVLQQKENKVIETKDIRVFLELMVEDVKRESEGEVVWSEKLTRSIRQKSAQMFKLSYPKLSMRVN